MAISVTQAARADDIVDARGCVADPAFESGWRKLSDFDDSKPLQSRSWPVQQYEAAQSEIRAINTEIAGLSAHMELDREARLAAKDMEQALKQGLKTNLLRAFWRLAWITYNTIGGPTGKTEMIKAGRSYAELFSDKISVASTAKMLGVVKKLVPKQYSKLPGNEGRVVNVGVDALLESLKNSEKSRVELVSGVVTKVLDTGSKELLDSNSMKADISPEEIEILRKQYIDQQGLQKAIAESYRLNAERQARIEALEAQSREATAKAAEWEKTEKLRVYSVLNEKCRKKPSLQFGLSAPARVVAGEVAEVHALLPPGRKEEEFMYAWSYNGELLVKSSLEADFQSMQLGPHTFDVQFIDKADGRNLGMISATIVVEEPPRAGAGAEAASGQTRVKISGLAIKPKVLRPGDLVEFEVAYSVSGLPQGKTVPVSVRYAGERSGGGNVQSYDQTVQGEVANGNFTSRYGFATTRWKPGRYTIHASVIVLPAVDFADGGFVLRQPDVAVTGPPVPPPKQPATGPSATTKAQDFVGDWDGIGTVVNVRGFDGSVRPGQQTPMKVRITNEGGTYRVYDLMDQNTPHAPMNSRVEGRSVVFYYRGPAVDTEGYEHPETPIDVSWTLTLDGNSLSGDFVMAMEAGNVTINVHATRAR